MKHFVVSLVMVMIGLSQPTVVFAEKNKLPVIGWIDGGCFAVNVNNLSVNTALFVVTLDAPQGIAMATIAGSANVESCGPLLADRRKFNESQGLFFYKIKSSTTFSAAIGIVAKVANAKVSNNKVLADIDADGKPEQFSICATSEGLSFDVWRTEPFKQKPIWSGYYYLGYDIERTCP